MPTYRPQFLLLAAINAYGQSAYGPAQETPWPANLPEK